MKRLSIYAGIALALSLYAEHATAQTVSQQEQAIRQSENERRIFEADSVYRFHTAQRDGTRKELKAAESELKTAQLRYKEAKRRDKEAANAAKQAKKSLKLEKKAQKSRHKATEQAEKARMSGM